MNAAAERYHNKGLRRIEFRVYSDVYNCMYRIFKSNDKKEVYVIKHDRDFDSPESLAEVLGRGPFNRVYEVKGNQVNDFAANGKYGWSVSEVVDYYVESIEKGRF